MLEFTLDSINIKPAMTYSRAGRTTIGPRCLSAVFGMGTGVSTWAWSPAVSDPALTRGIFSIRTNPAACNAMRSITVVSRPAASGGLNDRQQRG